MLKKILIGLAAVIALLVIVIALQPSHFHVERSAHIKAVYPALHSTVNDLSQWNSWSPWAKLDPDAKTSLEGPTSGVGAIFRWDGDHNVGAGSMTIIESDAPRQVKFRLDFLRPMKGTGIVRFDFKSEGDGTLVTWSMDGENNFMAKAMSLFMNCDKMIGGYFEEGLENLRKKVERPAPVPTPAAEPTPAPAVEQPATTLNPETEKDTLND